MPVCMCTHKTHSELSVGEKDESTAERERESEHRFTGHEREREKKRESGEAVNTLHKLYMQ